MARVTVEDCIVQIPNRFDLVMFAAQRAKALASGAEIMLDRDHDKNAVVALREIAETKLDLDDLRETLIHGMQKRVEPDRPEADVKELMVGEQRDWLNTDANADEAAPIDGVMIEEDPIEGDDDLDDEEEELEEDMGEADIGGRFEDEDVKD